MSNAFTLDGFDAYLRNVLSSDKDIAYLLAVATKYQNVLTTANASELLRLTHTVQRHAMRALAHLAKFNGCYEQWQRIIKQHGLHWWHADEKFQLL
jgi:hypothetical protein